MAEWSIAAVLKTVEVRASGGSNPSLSAEKGVNQVVTRFTPFFTPKNRGWVYFLNFKINAGEKRRMSLFLFFFLFVSIFFWLPSNQNKFSPFWVYSKRNKLNLIIYYSQAMAGELSWYIQLQQAYSIITNFFI